MLLMHNIVRYKCLCCQSKKQDPVSNACSRRNVGRNQALLFLGGVALGVLATQLFHKYGTKGSRSCDSNKCIK